MTLPPLPPGWSWQVDENRVGNDRPYALHDASGRATLRGSAGEVAAMAGRMETRIASEPPLPRAVRVVQLSLFEEAA